MNTFGEQVSSKAMSIGRLINQFFRQLSFERRPQPDRDPACCLLQRGGRHWAARDGRQWSQESYRRQDPGHPQKLCQQGAESWKFDSIFTLFPPFFSQLFSRNTSQAVAPIPRAWTDLDTTATCQCSRHTPPPLMRLLIASPSLPVGPQEVPPQVPWILILTGSVHPSWRCKHAFHLQALQVVLPSRYQRQLCEICPSGKNQSL